MWRMQFLDESTMLIKFGKLDCVIGRVRSSSSWGYDMVAKNFLRSVRSNTSSLFFFVPYSNSKRTVPSRQHSLSCTTFIRHRSRKCTTMHRRNFFEYTNHARTNSAPSPTPLLDPTNDTTLRLALTTFIPKIYSAKRNSACGMPATEGKHVTRFCQDSTQQKLTRTYIPSHRSAQAVKRSLCVLPFSPQSFSDSPYFDLSLFSYDEKVISATDR